MWHFSAMKTATLEDLTTRLSTVLAWVRSGEDVIVKGESPVRPAAPAAPGKVDWSQSTAFRDRTGEPVLSHKDLAELFEDMRGPY